jgi:hypothetical protein
VPNLSQRYIAALAQLSQFQGVIDGNDKLTPVLTHVQTGVQVAPHSTDEASEDEGVLVLTFAGGHQIEVVAYTYLLLQLAEHAAHQLHSVEEGQGQIHTLARQTWEHLSLKNSLE